MLMKFLSYILISFVICPVAGAQTLRQPDFLQANPQWVDSVFATLSPDERIAQLLMVAVTSDVKRALIGTEKSNPDYVEKLVKEYKVGGVVFFQGGPVPQARVTNRLQAVSNVPLLVAMDAEFGLAMRIDSTVRYPYQLTLGAIQGNDELIYQMGAQLARQARRLGVHLNFAPVADVNNNPDNPVINFRSFGENKYRVAEKAVAYMRGMQDHGLLTTAKHFPGHGDTGVDSHYALPIIGHDKARLDSVELYPFRELIRNGLSGAMIAHLSIPALDATPHLPSTLSRPIVTGLLRQELGFQGLIYSDAMNMKGVTNYFSNGLADAKGLEAGMDVLEFTEDVPKAIAEIKKAIANGSLTQEAIDARCKKLLAAKAWAGLDRYQPIDLHRLYEDLNPREAELTNRLLTEKALTILQNDHDLLPLRELDTLKIAVISIGSDSLTTFQKTASLYTKTDNFIISDQPTPAESAALLSGLSGYNLLLTGVHLSSIRPGANYGLTEAANQLLTAITTTGKAVVTVFGNPYVLNKLQQPEAARALIMAYQLTPFTEDLSAQLIFGAIPAVGKLPVGVNMRYRYGDGLLTPALDRLKYTLPEEVGLQSEILIPRIDSIMHLAITRKATPGGVVELAKDGKVFFHKAYGKHTYEGTQPVLKTDLYDLASVTKVTASTLALMKLYEDGLFDLDGYVSDYLRFFRKSNKADLRWRDVLTHRARLKAFIVFWKVPMKPDGTWKKRSFSARKSSRYPTEIVPEKLYIHRKYARTIFKGIKDSPLNATDEYVYSDLSFMLYPEVVRNLTGTGFEDYLKNNFYNKLGAASLTLNPTRFYNLDEIVPTEMDTFFRKTLVHGSVHDEAAAMLGGVSGHAGLFGNANDVMKVWQLFLQKGHYGGKQFLQPETLFEFTRYQFPEIGNRRGIGFDKPTFIYSGNAPRFASPSSYGHTGFTGIMTWADPAWGLTYVFLSNRVYPTRDNPRLGQMNARTEIMDIIYEELLKAK